MDLLQPLNLPPYPFKIIEQNGQLTVFDLIRKKNIIITPEEWVRQHFVQYLINQKHYPKTLIKLEGGHKFFGMSKRTDIIVFNKEGRKILLVECKAPSVTIDQKTFEQITRYNMVQQITLLAVTNGLEHYYCKINFEAKNFEFIRDLPDYNEK
jgi:hypothetical protein